MPCPMPDSPAGAMQGAEKGKHGALCMAFLLAAAERSGYLRLKNKTKQLALANSPKSCIPRAITAWNRSEH